jgi:hypothetical protein
VTLGRQRWPSKKAFFEHLATTYGVSAVAAQLRHTRGLSLREVAAWARKRPSRRVTVNGRTYESKSAFFRHLARQYGGSAGYACVKYQVEKLSLEDIAAWAKERSTRRKAEPVIVFGWRFRSFTAVYRYYYGYSPNSDVRLRWEQWQIFDGRPAYMFLLPRLGELSQMIRLDERGRFPPEDETRKPKSCLPTNTVAEPMSDEERTWAGALHRDGRAWLTEMRARRSRPPA